MILGYPKEVLVKAEHSIRIQNRVGGIFFQLLCNVRMSAFRGEEEESLGRMGKKEKYPEIKMLSLNIVLPLLSDQELTG